MAKEITARQQSLGLLENEQEELDRLRKEVGRLRMERDILKKSDGLLRQRKELRFQFISQHSEEWPIIVMCAVLQVSRSGFYAWRKRPASARSERQSEVVSKIRQIRSERHKDAYGSPRMHLELVDRGFEICEATVAKLMQKEELVASTHRPVFAFVHGFESRPSGGGKYCKQRVSKLWPE